MLFKNPKKGEMIITRTTEETEEHIPIRFISAITNTIVRDVYAIKTIDENGKDCFVVNSNISHDYGENAPPEGIVGVAYSVEGAGKMAHDYIRTQSQEIRTEYYPNHTLVDKVQLNNIE